jgi:two-component system LytT family response regulator
MAEMRNWLAPQIPDRMLDGFCPEPCQEEQFAVHCGGRMLFLRAGDVEWLEEADGGVALHVGKEIHLLQGTLAAVAARLPPGGFLRIAPSTLVNVQQIKEFQPMCHDRCAVVLRNGFRLTFMRAWLFSETTR